MTVAESCGLSMRQVVVAVSDCRGHGWMPRSRSRRMLLADRVGAIVELGHDAALRRDDWPCGQPEQLGRRDIAALVTAVLAAADCPAVSPSPIKTRTNAKDLAPKPKDAAPAERSAVHVTSTARAVAASG